MIVPILLLLAAAAATPHASPVSPGRGISASLARERAGNIRSLRYELAFHIPERKTEPIRASEVVRFELRTPGRVVLDFEQPRDRVLAVRSRGRAIPFQTVDGHITFSGTAGANAIEIDFLAGDEALNRNDDFLYTLFVPARAHLAFPCFDQPDLKARYTLTLAVPPGWQAVANGASVDGAPARFAETDPLPTYLFAFAAGKFRVETAERDGRTFRMFHRETDAAKVARNRDAIFDLHARALAWLEDYTGIRYPWGKFDFVLIPSFQFGGMEHPGAILYNAASLMLDASATQNQLLGRASVIAHETAHMWFGDLVTMRWFNDVWMKEVMANFMAAKIVNPSFPEINHDLRFLLSHHPAAYSVDRTAGANPIRQPLDNLNEAGSLYGAIIYDKAPVVMRQLEWIAGEEQFRDGLRDYLRKYSFSNATWTDLIAILDARVGGRLVPWSRDWVETRGRPTLRTELTVGPDGRISKLALVQPANAKGTLWPQRLNVVLGYVGRVERVAAVVDGRVAEVTAARGKERPLYVLPNGEGRGYGLFLLDTATLASLLQHLDEIPDAITRGEAWVDLWENLLERRVTPAAFFDLALRALPKETDEQNTQRVLADVGHAFWAFLDPTQRQERAPVLEALLREGVGRAGSAGAKSAWFGAFRNVVLTREGLEWLESVWRRETKIPGLPLAETDEIEMATALAVRQVPHWREILATQRDRTVNPDRKQRFTFVMPALDADPQVREQAFARFRDPANRAHEAWVLDSMRFLNHPLRAAHALRFVGPSLELLPEIQRTGDIFFPKRWMDAALSGHHSPAAAVVVREYLGRAALPVRLRWVVLSAADELFRTAR